MFAENLWGKTSQSLAEIIEVLENNTCAKTQYLRQSKDMEVWYAVSRRRILSLEANSKEVMSTVMALQNMSKKEFDTFARADPSFKAYQRSWGNSLSKLEKDARAMDKEARGLAGFFKKKAASILQTGLAQESASATSGQSRPKASVYDLAAVKAIDKISTLRGRVYDVELMLMEAAEDQTALSNVLPPREADQKLISNFKTVITKIGDYIESMADERSNLLGILDKIERN